MGTTRIKVIDLSAEKQEIKTSRKHAEKLSGLAKIKEEKKPKENIPAEAGPTQEQPVLPPPTGPARIAKTKRPEEIAPKTKAKVKLARHQGKKYLSALKLIDKNKEYGAKEAIGLLYQVSKFNFDPTVEAHLNVSDKNLRGNIHFPHPITTKKEKRILVFTDSPLEKTPKGQEIIWANEKTIEEIAAGKFKHKRDFDQVLATPKFMPKLAKIAKILGPARVMPNPKAGTVVEDIATALSSQLAGTVEYKTDPTAPVIHAVLGKLSLKPQQLEENLQALISGIGPTKIKKAVIKSTMSPGIKIDLTTLSS